MIHGYLSGGGGVVELRKHGQTATGDCIEQPLQRLGIPPGAGMCGNDSIVTLTRAGRARRARRLTGEG
jgi:hypothetical protein